MARQVECDWSRLRLRLRGEATGGAAGQAVGAAGADLAACSLAWIRRDNCDFLRAARFGWMTRLAAALSSFLAARSYCVRRSSRVPLADAAATFFSWVLSALTVARFRSRRFSFFRNCFFALRV